MNYRRYITDMFFCAQLIGAFVLCGSQFIRFLDTTQGQVLSMFIAIEVYLVLHLLLAIGAYRVKPSRVTLQTVWTFIVWLLLIGSDILAVYINGEYRWSESDVAIMRVVVFGTAIVYIIMRIWRISLTDPIIKAWLAMLFKAGPQFIMAYEVYAKGGAGVPMAAVIAGNITILIRMGQIAFALYETKWERNCTWLFISETLNEISWATVSIVWAFWYFKI